MKSASFDLADEAAERLRRTVPPNVLGEGPSPEEVKLQQQIKELTTALNNVQEYATKTAEKNAMLHIKVGDKDAQKEIDVYEAETNRMKALADSLSPDILMPVIQQMIAEALSTHLQRTVSTFDDPSQSFPSATPTVQDTGLLPPASPGNGGGNGGGVLGNNGPGQPAPGAVAGMASGAA
jgi:hypothetical protein